MVCEMEDTCCCLLKDVVGVRTWGIPRLVMIPVVALPVVSIEDSLFEVRKDADARFDDITLLDFMKYVTIGSEWFQLLEMAIQFPSAKFTPKYNTIITYPY